ncbi:hypothetical protein [Halpernia humi]|nr:hypothetical protein [Halpernia humi]
MNTLINKGVDESIPYFALESNGKPANIAEMKNGLSDFRQNFIMYFGKDVEYNFITAQKKISTNKQNSTPPNTTIVLLQFKNQKEFGVLQFLFDDNTKKILNFLPLEVKNPIPNMVIFYVIGLLGIIIPIFNVYVINRIRKSNLKRKWLKYIAIILLNFPTIIYNAVAGFSFKIVQFTFLGFGFSTMGYLNSTINLGIPLAGLYWFWKLKKLKNEKLIQPEDDLSQISPELV